MKVHESEKEKNTDIGDIEKYKKKQRFKKLIKLLLTVLIISVGVAVIYINREVIFEPLRGIFSKVSTTTDDEAGFPVNMPSSKDYRIDRLSDGFALLTDTYLCSYDSEGTQSFAVQHGYINPLCSFGEKSILIYDKGGVDFALYSKTSEIYKKSTENEIIVTASIGRGGYTAVVTSGGQYPNAVYVYDGSGNKKYTLRYIDEKVMQALVSPDNRYMYVTLVKSVNGDIRTEVIKHEINGEEIWSTDISDSLSFGISATDEAVMVITDEKICHIDSESGSVSSTYEYKGVLKDYDISTMQESIFLFDNSDKNETAVIMDEKGTVIATRVYDEKLKDVEIVGDEILILTENEIARYDADMNELSSEATEKGYVKIIRLDDGILFMGGNSIDFKNI